MNKNNKRSPPSEDANKSKKKRAKISPEGTKTKRDEGSGKGTKTKRDEPAGAKQSSSKKVKKESRNCPAPVFLLFTCLVTPIDNGALLEAQKGIKSLHNKILNEKDM